MGFLRRGLRVTSQRPEVPAAVTFENTATTIALVSALVLGEALTTRLAAPEVSERRVHQMLLCQHQEVREFIVKTVQAQDVGTYKQQWFNCTVDLGSEVLDVCSAVLDVNYKENEFNRARLSSYLKCLHERRFVSAANYILDHIPKATLDLYIHFTESIQETVQMGGLVSVRLQTYACCMLMVALVSSIFALLLLNNTLARWDEDTFPLLIRYLVPLNVLGILGTIIGIVMFFAAQSSLMEFLFSWNTSLTYPSVTLPMWAFLVPLAAIVIIFAIVGMLHTNYKVYYKVSARVTDVSIAAATE